MKAIWMIIIGIFLLVFNVKVPVGDAYPEMVIAEDMGSMFQNNVIDNFIGTSASVDILNDLIAFALIFLGSILLVKKSKKFIGAMLLIPIASMIYIRLPELPFQMQGFDLYLKVCGYQFLYTILEVGIEYFVIHGIIQTTDCMQNRWHNNEMMIGWIIAMVSKIFLVMLNFYGMKKLYIIYAVILIGSTIFYVNRLFKTLEFKPKQTNVE